jgi:hypothetical protein
VLPVRVVGHEDGDDVVGSRSCVLQQGSLWWHGGLEPGMNAAWFLNPSGRLISAMDVFELVIATPAGAALRRPPGGWPSYPALLALAALAWRCAGPDRHARSRAGAHPVRRAGAAGRGVRRRPRPVEHWRPVASLRAGGGRSHRGGRGGHRPLAGAGNALGRGHRARGDRGAARRSRRHRGAAPAPAAAPAAGDSRRRESLQRRERAAHLPAGRRGGDGGGRRMEKPTLPEARAARPAWC